DRRQRRRRQGAGGQEGAGDVPHPRAAEPREARRAQGVSRHLRRAAGARPGDPPRHLQPHPRAHRRGRVPPAGDGAGAAHPDPGLLCAGKPRPFRPVARQLRPL
nr:hypothetical protein [Tanacetum cinerariifolium]